FPDQVNYATSSSTISLYSNQPPTSVAIESPAVTYNADGTVTGRGSSPDGTPTGDVQLSVDKGTPQSATLDGTGIATFTLPRPSAGNHSLTASYAAQGNFAGSSADGTLHVAQAPIDFGISASTVTYNANGVVTVTVGSAAGTPGGSVSLSV